MERPRQVEAVIPSSSPAAASSSAHGYSQVLREASQEPCQMRSAVARSMNTSGAVSALWWGDFFANSARRSCTTAFRMMLLIAISLLLAQPIRWEPRLSHKNGRHLQLASSPVTATPSPSPGWMTRCAPSRFTRGRNFALRMIEAGYSQRTMRQPMGAPPRLYFHNNRRNYAEANEIVSSSLRGTTCSGQDSGERH